MLRSSDDLVNFDLPFFEILRKEFNRSIDSNTKTRTFEVGSTISKIPLYSQMGGSCGLSTFLMLINPERNLQLRMFLDKLYENIKFLKKKQKDEFKWSIAVDYLLIKAVFSSALRDYLSSKDSDIVDFYFPIKRYELKDYLLIHHGLVNKKVFNYHLHKWKTNNDLKILFYLFGGKFHAQPQEYPDGTGSFYFEEGDDKVSKIEAVREHLSKSSEFETYCIALNIGSYHWVAVSSILNDNSISINDPSGGRNFLTIKRLSSKFRFYFFSYDLRESIILNSKVVDPYDFILERGISR